MMRILILTHDFPPNVGGVERHLSQLCTYLVKRGHSVTVLTYVPLTTNVRTKLFESSFGLRTYRLPWIGRGLFHVLERYPLLQGAYLAPGLLMFGLIFLAARFRDVDVIHAHGLVPAFIGALLAKLFRKRLISSTHTIYKLHQSRLLPLHIRLAFSQSAVVLALGQLSRDQLMRVGIPSDRIQVYRHWVDLDTFRILDKTECRRKLGLTSELTDELVVLFVGRLIRQKGAHSFAEAASKLRLPALFVVIGDGPMSEQLSALALRNKKIRLVGKVPIEKLVEWYNAADVVAVPSLYEEAFGIVAIESLACGTPVIASSLGALREIIAPNVGLLISANPDKIARAIETLSKATISRDDCRRHVVLHYSEANAEVIEKSYLSLPSAG